MWQRSRFLKCACPFLQLRKPAGYRYPLYYFCSQYKQQSVDHRSSRVKSHFPSPIVTSYAAFLVSALITHFGLTHGPLSRLTWQCPPFPSNALFCYLWRQPCTPKQHLCHLLLRATTIRASAPPHGIFFSLPNRHRLLRTGGPSSFFLLTLEHKHVVICNSTQEQRAKRRVGLPFSWPSALSRTIINPPPPFP